VAAAVAQPLPGTGFERHQTVDAEGRPVTFYVTPAGSEARPLVLYIQGSGCTPMFRRDGERLRAGYASALAPLANPRLRVVTVEKPGIRPESVGPTDGTAEGCSTEFRRDHTLDRWLASLHAALAAARQLPGSRSEATLVIGHSEGGTVAARLARRDGQVSHVAVLSAGGQGAEFDMIERARRSATPGGEEAAMAEAEARWRAIRERPGSDEMVWGHPFRRWSSFGQAIPAEDLLATRASVFLVHGTRDESVPIASFDLTTLVLARRDRVETLRLEGADHALNHPGQAPPEGLRAVFSRVLGWYSSAQ